MSKPFTLFLDRVHCEESQFAEPGSDEMYLLGFGISKIGHRFAIRPRALGSFDTGDTSNSGYPKTLVDTQVPDDETVVSTCIWLFERDSGGLAAAGDHLEAYFNSQMDFWLGNNANLGLSPDARQYYAFGQSMDLMQYAVVAGASAWNSDDILQHIYHDHLPSARPPLGINTYQHTFRGGGLGAYTLTFRYQLARPEPVVVV